jgi:hypothetical protein
MFVELEQITAGDLGHRSLDFYWRRIEILASQIDSVDALFSESLV